MQPRVIPFAAAVQAYRPRATSPTATTPALPNTPPAGAHASVRPIGVQVPADSVELSSGARSAQARLLETTGAAHAHRMQLPTVLAHTTHPLAAARVPGQVYFDTHAPTPTTTPTANPSDSRHAHAQSAPPAAMPFYSHPALQNVAATNIAAGQHLDLQA